jgi:hypothetical protein
MSRADRANCSEDAQKIISNTLRDLIIDIPDVVIQGLSLLDHICREHAGAFVPYLASLFLRLHVRFIFEKIFSQVY